MWLAKNSPNENDEASHVDDTGFTADGEFIDGVLHPAGMILYRVR